MRVIGIDEVGRGPLAGPVTVCAVSCDERKYKLLLRNKNLPTLGKDSKKLKESDREIYFKYLKKLSRAGIINYQVTHVSNLIIDKKGISYSIKRAIDISLSRLEVKRNSKILLDGGLRVGAEFKNQKTIIKGDEKEKIIAWASILAKVSRDNLMRNASKKFPLYSFEIHKGYGTRKHIKTIKNHGLSLFHRKSFCKV